MPNTLFISDVHLSADHPGITARFKRFLKEQAEPAKALYILGDFFDVWVGDDDSSEFSLEIIEALQACSQHTPIYLMHGNHDFLVGTRFAQRANVTLIPDPFVLETQHTNILLTHGDLFCLNDQKYLRYRKKTRNMFLQTLFLWMPRFVRLYIASKLKSKSQSDWAKRPDLKPTTDQTRIATMLKQHDCSHMIHGHIHQPSQSDTVTVLGAWPEQGEYAVLCESGKISLETL